MRSPLLAHTLGIVGVSDDHIEWLGFDALAFGEWSLLHDGLFKKPDLFAAHVPHVNTHGLFATHADAAAFTPAYLAAMGEHSIEPFAPPGIYDESAGRFGTAFTVEVGRVQVP